MAHRKRSHARSLVAYRHRAGAMVKPLVIKTTKVVKAARHHIRRHHGHTFSMGGLFNKTRMGIVAGALAFGFLEKQTFFQNLPSLPLIGKSGTIGLGAYLLSNGGRNKLADDVCTAALVIAAHEFGSTGSVVGQDDQGPGIGYVAGY